MWFISYLHKPYFPGFIYSNPRWKWYVISVLFCYGCHVRAIWHRLQPGHREVDHRAAGAGANPGRQDLRFQHPVLGSGGLATLPCGAIARGRRRWWVYRRNPVRGVWDLLLWNGLLGFPSSQQRMVSSEAPEQENLFQWLSAFHHSRWTRCRCTGHERADIGTRHTIPVRRSRDVELIGHSLGHLFYAHRDDRNIHLQAINLCVGGPCQVDFKALR